VQAQIIFITGTDTGVGKTLLTGMLLHQVRQAGCQALAMKPFCSGGREDVELLDALQDGELIEDEINPFYFREPLAPLVAARKNRRSILLKDVLGRIDAVTSRLRARTAISNQRSHLLIEGAGGLLVPLGERGAKNKGTSQRQRLSRKATYTAVDVIAKLGCVVIIVAANRLGTINHTILTVRTLQHAGIKQLTIVLMGQRKPDNSAKTNPEMLAELVAPIRVFSIPFLRNNALEIVMLKKNAKKIKKTLAQILA